MNGAVVNVRASEQSPLAHPSALSGRPLWSVMIPTYECAGYLRETLAGVLDQIASERRQVADLERRSVIGAYPV